jgi:predicted metal-dependent hydrolase
MNQVEIVVIFVIVVIALFYVQKKYMEVEYVISNVDNTRYLVQNKEDKEKAANMLAKLNKKIKKLLKHLEKKDPENEDIKRLVSNYNVENISEGTEDSNYTSYSVNKGEKIVFCLRERDGSDNFVNENVLMYVAVHELGHLMTSEIGHTETFWTNFKYLLNEAVKIKVYKKIDYSENPTEYCGINIKSSII